MCPPLIIIPTMTQKFMAGKATSKAAASNFFCCHQFGKMLEGPVIGRFSVR